MVSESEFRRQLREAQRKAQREVDRINRQNQQKVDDYNRKVQRHNQQVVDRYNRHVDAVNKHNQQTFNALASAAAQPRRVTFTVQEQQLVDRVQGAVSQLDNRDCDIFLSYARIDGADVAAELRAALEAQGVTVWQDEIGIRVGKSMSRAIDHGLAGARAGLALLTPAYLTGRFWTERELGALLHKDTLIPVLHNVTFDDVKHYSGILSDLFGFVTSRDSIEVIASKVAAAVMKPEAA